MGTYLKSQKARRRTVSEALSEAEEDHLLDCPNADFSTRAASLSLDVVLFFLAYSGLKHLCMAMNAHLGHLDLVMPSPDASHLRWIAYQISTRHELFSQTALVLLRVALGYFYFVWSVAYAGGSPGKLLLGLRIVDAKTGQLLGFPQALFRETLGKIFSAVPSFYGFGLAYFRKDRKALHDLMCRTSVKKVHGAR